MTYVSSQNGLRSRLVGCRRFSLTNLRLGEPVVQIDLLQEHVLNTVRAHLRCKRRAKLVHIEPPAAEAFIPAKFLGNPFGLFYSYALGKPNFLFNSRPYPV